jgi:hemoglobin-like flavoprotein
MTGNQIRLVQDSFRQVIPLADAAAKLFYTRLFELDPGLEALFKGDMVEQERKLMQTLGLAVVSLHRPEQILPALRALGARHVAYGVREVDYDSVGRALLWALGQKLGDDFTPEVEAAWAEVYAALTAEMRGGAVTIRQAEAQAYTHPVTAVANPEGRWGTRFERRSPRYTTRPQEVLTID